MTAKHQFNLLVQSDIGIVVKKIKEIGATKMHEELTAYGFDISHRWIQSMIYNPRPNPLYRNIMLIKFFYNL